MTSAIFCALSTGCPSSDAFSSTRLPNASASFTAAAGRSSLSIRIDLSGPASSICSAACPRHTQRIRAPGAVDPRNITKRERERERDGEKEMGGRSPGQRVRGRGGCRCGWGGRWCV
eukprot:1850373-Rhodomonas_salina.1